MVAPVGSSVWEQELVVLDKLPNGKVTSRTVYPVRFVPMVKAK
jgi:protein-L-isoaspartate O-methyltransferase